MFYECFCFLCFLTCLWVFNCWFLVVCFGAGDLCCLCFVLLYRFGMFGVDPGPFLRFLGG